MVFSVIGPGIVGAAFVAGFVRYIGKRWFFYSNFPHSRNYIAGKIFNAATKKSNFGIEEPPSTGRKKSVVKLEQEPGKGKSG